MDKAKELILLRAPVGTTVRFGTYSNSWVKVGEVFGQRFYIFGIREAHFGSTTLVGLCDILERQNQLCLVAS